MLLEHFSQEVAYAAFELLNIGPYVLYLFLQWATLKMHWLGIKAQHSQIHSSDRCPCAPNHFRLCHTSHCMDKNNSSNILQNIIFCGS